MPGEAIERNGGAKPPNIMLLITDQQRAPRHWPDEPGWLEELMPNDAELSRTGLTFKRGFTNTAMCSPSRATLFTGRFPREHGVELTLTAADLHPNPKNTGHVISTMGGIIRRREAPARRVLTQFTKGLFRIGHSRGNETPLPKDVPNIATLLRAAGYHVALKGKWHLTHPQTPDGLLGGWGEKDARLIEEDYGFSDWEAPDAGENAKAENFGGGNAGPGEGWDEVYTQQVESWLGRAKLPEPFCLIVSLVNPHDVLGYPDAYERGGYSREEFRELGVGLPPTVDEDMRSKPNAHSLMRMGMTAYMGPLRNREDQLDYVNFYAYLHRHVDAKIGRILKALGPADDPGSLRSRTVIVRCADHGEMGLSHGGLRQKAFNAYEETINIPFVFSNPKLFPNRVETDSLASLVDVLPTVLSLAGAEHPQGLRGRDLSPILDDPAATVRDHIHFTYDDHQAATAMTEAPGKPNRVRAIRTDDAKYAFYFDPAGEAPTEYELYDLENDPLETENLIGLTSGETQGSRAAELKRDLSLRLDTAMQECGTAPE